jgi:hypothetical protein
VHEKRNASGADFEANRETARIGRNRRQKETTREERMAEQAAEGKTSAAAKHPDLVVIQSLYVELERASAVVKLAKCLQFSYCRISAQKESTVNSSRRCTPCNRTVMLCVKILCDIFTEEHCRRIMIGVDQLGSSELQPECVMCELTSKRSDRFFTLVLRR